jgi:hypothetical protein
MNSELERMRKGAVMASFNELFWHSSGMTEENHEKVSKNSQDPKRDSNRTPPEYKSEELLPEQNSSFKMFKYSYNVHKIA